MPTKKSRGKINARRKGADGERELSNILKEHGFDARRGQQYCGNNGDADVVGMPGIHIECKRVKNLNLSRAIEQAVSDCKPDNIPVVISRKDREPWYVTIKLDDFIEIYKGKFTDFK